MTSKDAYALKAGTSVVHKLYGAAIVSDVIPDFGPTIIPSTIKGRLLLQYDSGCPNCPINELWRTGFPYLASDYKRNLTTLNNKSK